MTGDDDLKAFMPDAPPPAPKRREMAIVEALARFDGAAAPPARPRREKAPWWNGFRHPQAGFLATAALVAAISLPVAWTALDPGTTAGDEQISHDSRENTRTIADGKTEAPTPVAIAAPMLPEDSPVTEQVAAARPPVSTPAPKRVEMAQASPAAPVAKAEEREGIIVSAQRAARPVQDSPSAISAFSSADASEESVVVTGRRIAAQGAPRRGDWNACTVNDPSQKLSECKRLANKGAKDVRLRADAHLSDGLKHAWEGDLDEAIVSFDQAIAAAPDLSVAYLNRGLAYDRRGESARAIADLDRAVRHAPQSARAYYNRSLVLRKQGEDRRANLDERRASNLDSRYQAAPRPD